MSLNHLFTLAFLFFSTSLFAQEDEGVKLDALSAPQSPAANLMGFTDSEIIKPESPTDFMVNVRNVSNDFTKVPNSLAMDFRLKSMFENGGDNFTNYVRLKQQGSDKIDIKNNIAQTALISIGYKNYDQLQDSLFTGQGFGAGFKFSLFRGKDYSDEFKQSYAQLRNLHSTLNNNAAADINAFKSSNAEYLKLDAEEQEYIQKRKLEKKKAQPDQSQIAVYDAKLKAIGAEKQKLISDFTTDFNNKEDIKAEYAKIKDVIENMEFKTYGFVWDFAGGIVWDYPTNNFDYALVGKSGLWTTMGYEAKNGFSFLGLARGLYNPDLTFENDLGVLDTADVMNFDFGGRILYEHPGKSFSLSAEGLARASSDSNTDFTYKFTLNAGYELSKNMKLTFIFGRDFDGQITRDGNLVTALQFVMGLGSTKRLQ